MMTAGALLAVGLAVGFVAGLWIMYLTRGWWAEKDVQVRAAIRRKRKPLMTISPTTAEAIQRPFDRQVAKAAGARAELEFEQSRQGSGPRS